MCIIDSSRREAVLLVFADAITVGRSSNSIMTGIV